MILKSKSEKCGEFYLTLEIPDENIPFERRVILLLENYDMYCADNYLNNNTAIYMKFYLSDISNHFSYVKNYIKDRYDNVLCICVGQSPASGAKIALEAYHIKVSAYRGVEKKLVGNKLIYKHGPYLSIYSNLESEIQGNSYEQTENTLYRLQDELKSYNGNLYNNVLRTWFYIRDIDNNYTGMVKFRREMFEKENMTKNTHFISSTGIEGSNAIPAILVQLNYLATMGLKPEQVKFMVAPEYMIPTHEYGVTFERGTQVIYGNCSHYYISGTASIDKKGNVLYFNDIIKQLDRIFINIQALLEGYNASLDDMKILLVYLRDFSDYKIIDDYLKKRIPDSLPYIILHAAVCRPSWLVEIEGIAIKSSMYDQFDNFK